MDEITIERLRVPARIGVHRWEQAIRQPLLLTVTARIDTQPSAALDSLRHGVDYGKLARSIQELFRTEAFRLIESAADRVAALVLAESPAAAVTVQVEKPFAVAAADSVSVRIYRERSQGPAS